MSDISDQLSKRERAAIKTLSEALDDAQLLALSHIDQRTRSGVDIHNVPFVPYSESYQKRKNRRGQGTRVNLRLTGDMLSDLDVLKENEFRRVIHLKDEFSDMKGKWHHQGRGRNPIRQWFGLADYAVDQITNLFRQRLQSAQSRISGTTITKKLRIDL